MGFHKVTVWSTTFTEDQWSVHVQPETIKFHIIVEEIENSITPNSVSLVLEPVEENRTVRQGFCFKYFTCVCLQKRFRCFSDVSAWLLIVIGEATIELNDDLFAGIVKFFSIAVKISEIFINRKCFMIVHVVSIKPDRFERDIQ